MMVIHCQYFAGDKFFVFSLRNWQFDFCCVARTDKTQKRENFSIILHFYLEKLLKLRTPEVSPFIRLRVKLSSVSFEILQSM